MQNGMWPGVYGSFGPYGRCWDLVCYSRPDDGCTSVSIIVLRSPGLKPFFLRQVLHTQIA